MSSQTYILQTAQLKLRQLSDDDFGDLYEMFNDPLVMRYYPGLKSEEETRNWLKWNFGMYEKYGHGLWAVELKSDSTFVGQVGLVIQDVENKIEVEIGYLLKSTFFGKGFAVEAAQASRDFGFNQLKRERLISLIDPKNAPSIGVAERVGMKFEKAIPRWGKEISIYSVSCNPGERTD